MQLPEVWIACISTVAKSCQDVRCLLQIDPVVLNILARGEMAIAAIILTCDVGKHAHLAVLDSRPYGHGYPQHVGVALHV